MLLKGNGTFQTQTPDNTTTTMVFAGLAAGTEYTVGVDTVNGNQKSTTVEAKFFTSKYEISSYCCIVFLWHTYCMGGSRGCPPGAPLI